MLIHPSFRIASVGLLIIFLMNKTYADVDINITANIINNTCSVNIENNGYIHIPIVGLDYFSSRGNPPTPLQPTDNAGGTPFKIKVSDCDSGTEEDVNRLHFTFQPQSGIFPPDSKQVFINEASDGAQNVGLVIFNDETNTNVLKTDGTSDVVLDASDKSTGQYFTDYSFYVRYQNTGPVSAGKVTSHVLVSVIYD